MTRLPGPQGDETTARARALDVSKNVTEAGRDLADPTRGAMPSPSAYGGDPSDTTLSELVDQFEAAGFTGQMAARPGGQVRCFSCHTDSDAARVELVDLLRIEGASDPDDMSAVAALVCPNCGARATAVLGYGPEADEDDADVLLRLQSRR